jgi:hypothetical protein
MAAESIKMYARAPQVLSTISAYFRPCLLHPSSAVRWFKVLSTTHHIAEMQICPINRNSKIPWYPKLLYQRENALASF